MYEVVALGFLLIVWVPVATDGQDRLGSLVDGHDVGQRDTVVVLIPILVVLDDEVDVHLQQLVAVVSLGPEAQLLGYLLLYLVKCISRLRQLHITVEPCGLQARKLVHRFTEDMGDAFSDFQAGRAIRDDHILCGHIHRHLTPQRRVEIHLLERIAC